MCASALTVLATQLKEPQNFQIKVKTFSIKLHAYEPPPFLLIPCICGEDKTHKGERNVNMELLIMFTSQSIIYKQHS